MSKQHKKTNAMRILDSHGVSYKELEYEWEEGHGTGVHAAESLHIPVEQVYKTLVALGSQTGPLVCCIPVAKELDLKALAKASSNKSVELLPTKELLGLTGYLRGGCSPVGMKKAFPTYLDASMDGQTEVYVSAGLRGKQLCLNPQDLKAVTNGQWVEVTR